jgi:hypothetical protein
VSVNVALSIAEANADVNSTVRANIRDSDVTASGDVIVKADATATVHTLGVGVSVAVGGAGTVGVSGAGAAATTSNTVATTVEAVIADSDLAEGQGVTAGGNVMVAATDDLNVTADAKAASAAITGGTVAVSVAIAGAVATNAFTGSTRSGVRNSRVDANSGDVHVSAESKSVLNARPDAIAIGLAIGIGGSASGSGAVARNISASTIEAFIDDQSTVEASNSIIVEASDNSDSTASIVSVALSGGLTGAAIGVGVARNTATNTTAAYIEDSAATAQGGSIRVDADATQAIDSETTVLAVSASIGAAGAGGDANTTLNSDVEAYARDATLAASSGIFIDSDSDHTANARSVGGAASAVAVSAMFSEASIGGVTRAFADGVVTANANKLEITADSIAKALPDALSATISLDGGPGAFVKSTVDRTTEAYVGTQAGVTPGAMTNLTIDDGDLLIHANSNFTAKATPISLGLGGNSIALALTSATIDGATLAYLGESVTLTAGELDVNAASTETATANAVVVAIAAGAGVSAATSEAIVDSDVEAFLGTRSGNTPTGGAITDINIAAGGTGDGSVIVDANSNKTANADASGGAGSFAAAIAFMRPTAEVGGTTQATIDGAVTIDALSLDVTASGQNLATAEALVASVAIGGPAGAGVFASAEITETADVRAAVGAGVTVTVSGALRVDASHQGAGNKAIARAIGAAGGSLAGVSVMLADATVGGAVIAGFDGDVITASQVTLQADGQNFADADTLAAGFGAFGGAGSGALAEVTGQADVEALVGSASSISNRCAAGEGDCGQRCDR